jgi:hypothetical protein
MQEWQAVCGFVGQRPVQVVGVCAPAASRKAAWFSWCSVSRRRVIFESLRFILQLLSIETPRTFMVRKRSVWAHY